MINEIFGQVGSSDQGQNVVSVEWNTVNHLVCPVGIGGVPSSATAAETLIQKIAV